MRTSNSILILCANLKGNLGDFAILEAMGRVLLKHFPDCEVSFYHHGNKGEDTERLAAFERTLPPGMRSVGSAPSGRRPYFLRKFTKSLMRGGLHYGQQRAAIGKWADRLAQDEDFCARIKTARAVFFAGGSQWGKGDLNMNMFGQLLCVRQLNAKAFIFPFSISESLIPCNGSQSLKELLRLLCNPIAVRDIETYELLNQIGVPAQLFCDSVFALDGICPTQGSAEAGNLVFICITSKGGLTAGAVAKVIEALHEQQMEVALFSTCEIEDEAFYRQIKKLIDVDLVAPKSWQDAVFRLGQARFVVTNRLHCLIFSCLIRTPVVPITNRVKVRGFARDAGLDLSFSSLEEVAHTEVSSIAARRDETIAAQKSYLAKSAETLNHMMLQMVDVINAD